MTRRTRGLCIGCGALVALNVLAGCAQKQNGTAAAPQSAEAVLANAAVTTVSNAISTATGANRTRPKIPGAVPMSSTGIKRNGRGGYDVSARQRAALRRAHVYRDRYGVVDRTPKPTTRPSTPPASR